MPRKENYRLQSAASPRSLATSNYLLQILVSAMGVKRTASEARGYGRQERDAKPSQSFEKQKQSSEKLKLVRMLFRCNAICY